MKAGPGRSSRLRRAFPPSLLVMLAAGGGMVWSSMEVQQSPLTGVLGLLIITVAAITWLVVLAQQARGIETTPDPTPFVVRGTLPPWPTPPVLVPVMACVMVAHLAATLLAAEQSLHVRTLFDVEEESCEVFDHRVSQNEDRHEWHLSFRVRTADQVESGWLSAPEGVGLKLRDKQGKPRNGPQVLPCYRSGSGAHQIELERPSGVSLWHWSSLSVVTLLTLLLLLVRQLRAWRFRGGLSADSALGVSASEALKAACEAMGPQVPAGFTTRFTLARELQVRSLRVGRADADAWASVLVSVGAFALLASLGQGWQSLVSDDLWTAFQAAVIGLLVGGLGLLFIPRFVRLCLGSSVLTFAADELLIQHRLLLMGQPQRVRRQDIRRIMQVAEASSNKPARDKAAGDNSAGDNSAGDKPASDKPSVSWHLKIELDEQPDCVLLRGEEAHRSRWLGELIAAWAGVSYEPAQRGPSR